MKSKFKPGQAIVFEPKWAVNKRRGVPAKYDIYSEPHTLKYGQVVHYLAEHSPARGHCIVVDYDGKITTMVHPEDFRLATDEEV